MAASVTVKDGKLNLTGPGVFEVGEPIGETIEVDEGKTRVRTVPAGTTVTGNVEDDGGRFIVDLIIPSAAVAPVEEASGATRYRRFVSRWGVTYQRTPGPVKFDPKDTDQEGIV